MFVKIIFIVNLSSHSRRIRPFNLTVIKNSASNFNTHYHWIILPSYEFYDIQLLIIHAYESTDAKISSGKNVVSRSRSNRYKNFNEQIARGQGD